MNFSKSFLRWHWVSLVLIYLVIIAGSVVRTSGSGMGCPDWPKCFGQWIPPTDASQLPKNYREPLLEKRVKKAEKFSRFLSAIGFKDVAEKIKNDPYLQGEEPFNAKRTWTEYGNRLIGFLAGNVVLALFIWTFIRYRKHKKMLLLAGVNAFLMAFQGWFGSIVVASNLVPWTITVHLFAALLILGIQHYQLYKISPSHQKTLTVSSRLKKIIAICLVLSIVQMFLGTQVRESIDELYRQGFGRETWFDKLGLGFLVHRSFSWIVLFLIVYVFYQNERFNKYSIIRLLFFVLILELVGGTILSYFDLPSWVQVSHLLFASILLGLLFVITLRSKSNYL